MRLHGICFLLLAYNWMWGVAKLQSSEKLIQEEAKMQMGAEDLAFKSTDGSLFLLLRPTWQANDLVSSQSMKAQQSGIPRRSHELAVQPKLSQGTYASHLSTSGQGRAHLNLNPIL